MSSHNATDSDLLHKRVIQNDFESTDSASNSFILNADPLESMEFNGSVGSITGGYDDGAITWVLSNSNQTLTGTVAGDPGASATGASAFDCASRSRLRGASPTRRASTRA